MSFRYNVFDLDSTIKLPLKCECVDRRKWEGLGAAVINSWHKFADHKTMPMIIVVEGVEYELKKRDWQPSAPTSRDKP